MKTIDYARRVRLLTADQAKGIIIQCHELLDRVNATDAAHAPCDDPKCNSHLVHRVHELVENAQATEE